MTKNSKNEKELHKKEGIKIEHSQEKNTPTTEEVIHYKRGYMDINSAIQQKRKEEVIHLAEKIEKILESDKDTYKKKVALFNLVKDLEIGEPQPLKEKRTNHLLQTRLYNELAKKSMEEYKKTTMETFSKN